MVSVVGPRSGKAEQSMPDNKRVFIRSFLTLFSLCVMLLATQGQLRAECPKPASLPKSAFPEELKADANSETIVTRLRGKLDNASYSAVTFGDSLMFGWSESRLSSALGRPTLNAAVGGGTQTILWELNNFDWSKLSPDFILLFVGTNNLDESECDVFWSIQTVVEAAKAKFPKAQIAYMSLLPPGINHLQLGKRSHG